MNNLNVCFAHSYLYPRSRFPTGSNKTGILLSNYLSKALSYRLFKSDLKFVNYLEVLNDKKIRIFFFVDLKLQKTEGAIRNGNKTRGRKEEKKKFLQIMVFNATFQQYFSCIMTVSFIDGGNRSNRRKSPTCRMSLTNFIT